MSLGILVYIIELVRKLWWFLNDEEPEQGWVISLTWSLMGLLITGCMKFLCLKAIK